MAWVFYMTDEHTEAGATGGAMMMTSGLVGLSGDGAGIVVGTYEWQDDHFVSFSGDQSLACIQAPTIEAFREKIFEVIRINRTIVVSDT